MDRTGCKLTEVSLREQKFLKNILRESNWSIVDWVLLFRETKKFIATELNISSFGKSVVLLVFIEYFCQIFEIKPFP